jgi:hypothetical protein
MSSLHDLSWFKYRLFIDVNKVLLLGFIGNMLALSLAEGTHNTRASHFPV